MTNRNYAPIGTEVRNYTIAQVKKHFHRNEIGQLIKAIKQSSNLRSFNKKLLKLRWEVS